MPRKSEPIYVEAFTRKLATVPKAKPADDRITPAKLRAAGWTHDKADKSCWWIDLDDDKTRTLYFFGKSRPVEYLCWHVVVIRTVTGWSDLCALVAALKGDSK
jgi:hypothetical protein